MSIKPSAWIEERACDGKTYKIEAIIDYLDHMHAESEEKSEEDWKDGDEYWYMDDTGVIEDECFDILAFGDRFRLSIGNMFRTEAAAEAYKLRLIDVMGK